VASGGTLFLDEIGETSMALQVKLLRVLDEMKIRPVGSALDFSVDVRLISATNRDLEKLVADGRFREDFYYRLNVIPIYVPLLRERRDDILLLAHHFLDIFCRRSGRRIHLTPETEMILEKYHWPGNVRELENIIERAAALCDGDGIEPDDLPVKICCSGEDEPHAAEFPPEGIDLTTKVEAFERSLIRQALMKASNSQTRAARLLRLSPRSLRYKIEKFNMKCREN
jgi:two-component system response regulator PilR (NtrC family)